MNLERLPFEQRTNEQIAQYFFEQKAPLKGAIIPDEWKDNIDEIISEQLLSANRYFASTNPELMNQIEHILEKNPQEFLTELKDRWWWHNMFYELLLEPSILELLPESHFALTPKRIGELEDVYKTSSLVDQATLVTSAAIKKYLDKWIPVLTEGWSEQDRQVLMTPPEESFWVQYVNEHLELMLMERGGDTRVAEYKESLLRKYHAADEKIFEGRMRDFEQYKSESADDLRALIESGRISEDHEAKHSNLTLERPQLKAIRDIIIYDNVEEHRISRSLIGVSGFVLRKKILEYLNDTKILSNEGGIYEFDDDQIIGGLEKLREYRTATMFKKVDHKYQPDEETCSSTSLSMALKYFGKSDTTSEEIFSLHEKASAPGYPGEFYSLLAVEAKKLGLDVEMVHSNKDLFSNDKDYMPSELYENLLKEYSASLEDAVKLGARDVRGVAIDSDLLKQYLTDGYLVLLAGKSGQALHTVLVAGYNDQGFIFHDPTRSKTTVERYRGELEAFSQTDIGSWALALRGDQSTVTHLLNKLPDYQKRSLGYLTLERKDT